MKLAVRVNHHKETKKKYLKSRPKVWRDGSATKNTGCSFRESRFDSQNPHGKSQIFITPVPRDLMLSSDL